MSTPKSTVSLSWEEYSSVSKWSNPTCPEVLAFQAAYEGRLDDVKVMHQSYSGPIQLILSMIVMGATDGDQKAVGNWALVQGACILFAFKQPRKEFVRDTRDSNQQLSMLRGPGEVKKGTFVGSA